MKNRKAIKPICKSNDVIELLENKLNAVYDMQISQVHTGNKMIDFLQKFYQKMQEGDKNTQKEILACFCKRHKVNVK